MTTSLEHFGVPGMKWGVRKFGSSGSSGSSSTKKRRTSDQVIRADRAKAVKNVRRLSDKDLDARISRIEKEKKLRTLTAEDIQPGRTIAKTLLKNAGTKVAATVLAGSVMYGIKATMTKKFDAAEAVKYLVPVPKNK